MNVGGAGKGAAGNGSESARTGREIGPAAAVEQGEAEELSAVEKLFRETDKDGSGSLDGDEIAGLCKSMGSKLSKSGLKAAMLEMDGDGSGGVDFDEFNKWWGLHGGKALARFPAANPLRGSDESDDDDDSGGGGGGGGSGGGGAPGQT